MHYGERFNSISHLIGAGLAMAGTAVLVVVAARVGDPWKIVSFSIYGAMLELIGVRFQFRPGAARRPRGPSTGQRNWNLTPINSPPISSPCCST